VSGFTTPTDACVPASTLVALRCAGADPVLVRGEGSSQLQRFIGGPFAVAAALPSDARLLGSRPDMQVYSVPHERRWLYVSRGDIVERWLPLPVIPIPTPAASAISVGATLSEPPPTETVPPSPGTVPSVFFIGDSITRGGTLPLQMSLPGWSTGFDAVVGRSSYSGVSIASTLAVSTVPPDVVVVELGTNDSDPVAFRANARAILTSLQDVPLVIWQTTHGPMSRIPEINTQIRRVVRGFQNTVIADWDAFIPPEDLTSDGVHPLAQNEDEMAKLLVPMLQDWVTAAASRRDASCPGATG
jgi:lysophospholipase L1-like esterase